MCNYCVTIDHIALQLLSSFTDNEQTNWWNNANNHTKQNIIDYLNDNTINSIINPEALEFVKELINFSIQNGGSFSFNNNIDPNNSLSFNNVNEFEDYLETFSNNISDELSSEIVNSDTKIAKFKKRFNLLSINVEVNQSLNPYNINGVSSSMSGFTLATSYEQTTESDLAEITTNGNIVTVKFYGNFNIDMFLVEGLGTIYTFDLTIIVKIDKTTGNPISIEVIGFPQ